MVWKFKFSVLKHFGFNESFVRWVKTLYSDIQTCVINNGWISEVFKNSRGIRQGCPLSALLFVLSVEIMACRLRNNEKIEGIKIKLNEKEHSIQISQLADDTTLFCRSKKDVELAMNEIEIFGSFSGLILNRNKTEGLWIGKLKSCKDKVGGINWSTDPVKALGVYFGHDKEECEKRNWENRLEKMKTLLSSWQKRRLTIIGKILIIKALILPIFTFIGTACIIPKSYLEAIESSCFKFIWDNKPDKVKRNVLISPNSKGGLGMIDFWSYFTALKASWVCRLIKSGTANWSIIPNKYFNSFGANWLIFKTNNGNTRLNPNFKNIPAFYIEVFKCWNITEGGPTRNPISFLEIRKQFIWNNMFIKCDQKTIVFENWIKSNIIYVNDIIDENGNISESIIFDKLKNKSNWISETNMIKKSLPKRWLIVLKSDSSTKSIVNVKKNTILWQNLDVNKEHLSNRILYKSIAEKKYGSSTGLAKWLTVFNIESISHKFVLYEFIFRYLQENKLKVFRWKVLQYIIPTQKLLFQWKISKKYLCNFCGQEEDYFHYFIFCPYLSDFWDKIQKILSESKIEVKISLKHLVLGYKIFDKGYFGFNFFLTVLSFSIFKSYYVSDQKTKQIDVFEIFLQEFKKRVEGKTVDKLLYVIANNINKM